MTRSPIPRRLALPAALLLALLAAAGPGQEEPAPPSEETHPPTLETLADRLERLERLVLGARAGEGIVSPDRELPGADPAAQRLTELERRVQRLELGASTPGGGLAQIESQLRQVESRLSRLESDLRSIRR